MNFNPFRKPKQQSEPETAADAPPQEEPKEEATAVFISSKVPVVWGRRFLHKIFVTCCLYSLLFFKADVGWLISATGSAVPAEEAY